MNVENFDLMRGAEGFLFSVSEILYYPVTLGLVLLIIYILASIGSLTREHLERRRGNYLARQAYRDRLAAALTAGLGAHPDLKLEVLLQEAERSLGRSVEKARFIVRAGPGIGLMGTLIPMGVALAALAQGSMPQMAEHMVSAFTAAVAGLGCGVAAFAIALVREQWVRADLVYLRYVTELALRDGRVAADMDMPAAAARPAEESA